MFLLLLKQCPENFALLILAIIELFARAVWIFLKGTLMQIWKFPYKF